MDSASTPLWALINTALIGVLGFAQVLYNKRTALQEKKTDKLEKDKSDWEQKLLDDQALLRKELMNDINDLRTQLKESEADRQQLRRDLLDTRSKLIDEQSVRRECQDEIARLKDRLVILEIENKRLSERITAS